MICLLLRVFQELLYGISAGFGSPQVPVAEILARAVPLLHGDQGGNGGNGGAGGMGGTKPKSSNFLQVPEVEGPRWVLQFYKIRTPSLQIERLQ